MSSDASDSDDSDSSSSDSEGEKKKKKKKRKKLKKKKKHGKKSKKDRLVVCRGCFQSHLTMFSVTFQDVFSHISGFFYNLNKHHSLKQPSDRGTCVVDSNLMKALPIIHIK